MEAKREILSYFLQLLNPVIEHQAQERATLLQISCKIKDDDCQRTTPSPGLVTTSQSFVKSRNIL